MKNGICSVGIRDTHNAKFSPIVLSSSSDKGKVKALCNGLGRQEGKHLIGCEQFYSGQQKKEK